MLQNANLGFHILLLNFNNEEGCIECWEAGSEAPFQRSRCPAEEALDTFIQMREDVSDVSSGNGMIVEENQGIEMDTDIADIDTG